MAFDKPYIASFSFSLALFINLVATVNAPIAIAAAPNLNNPIFLSCINIFSSVSSWIIEDSANKGPVIVNNIWENLPKFPPAIEATPDKADSANVPDMNALFNEFILWFIAAVCFCAWVANNASLLNLAFAAISFMFIPGVVGMFLATDPGCPGAVNGICLDPPRTPPVAAWLNWEPANATSSCLSAIPTSRPRAMSWPILLVLLDGEAVCASLSVALIADLALFIPIASKMAASSLLYLACCPALIPAIMFAPPPVPVVCALILSIGVKDCCPWLKPCFCSCDNKVCDL